MARYLLSFVGTQDPYSGRTNEPGSIATLAKHLRPLQEVRLLYTADLQAQAQDTREWLHSEGLCSQVHLQEVAADLSRDPIDLEAAIAAAREALLALTAKHDGEIILNGSSGTPAMKSAWPILQAAGYGPNARVWQVRNPEQMAPEQERVLVANLTPLRAEFDRQVLRRQIQDHNYSGALDFLPNSVLANPILSAWLRYGKARLALDFTEAQRALTELEQHTEVPPRFQQETRDLYQKKVAAIAWEGYFVAQIHHQTGQVGFFLMLLSALLETVLCARAEQETGLPLYNAANPETIWQQLQSETELYRHLQNWRVASRPLRCEGWLNRYHYQAILNFYYPPAHEIAEAVSRLCRNELLDSRNDLAHKLQGQAQMKGLKACEALQDLRLLLGERTGPNPYQALHQEIERHLGLPAEPARRDQIV